MDFKALVKEAEEKLAPHFKRIDEIAQENTEKVLAAFADFRVDAGMFASTDGYGYDDRGRDTLDKIYARVFGAESAFVRHSILSGTHALTIGLFGLLRPGDTLLAITAPIPVKRTALWLMPCPRRSPSPTLILEKQLTTEAMTSRFPSILTVRVPRKARPLL